MLCLDVNLWARAMTTSLHGSKVIDACVVVQSIDMLAQHNSRHYSLERIHSIDVLTGALDMLLR